MSAQAKWVSPVELAVGQETAPDSKPPPTPAEVTPILLSGTPKKGDRVVLEETVVNEAMDSPDESLDEELADNKGSGSFRWFVLFSLIFLLAVVVQDTILFVDEQFARHLYLGWGFLFLAGGAGVALLVLIVGEIVKAGSLRKIQNLQKQATRLRQEDLHGKGVPFIYSIMTHYNGRTELDPGYRKFQDALDLNLADGEILDLFSSQVIVTLDKKAYDIVVENSSVAALLTALSPMAWLDALLFLWRNVRMIRQIANCYGFRPGFFGTIFLVKRVLQGMLISATTDFLTDEAAESVGSSVTAVLFAKAGQGMANGLISARLGVQAMRYCRPVPFQPEEKPSLRRVRAKMVEQMKKRLS
jgi:putative membrane protein